MKEKPTEAEIETELRDGERRLHELVRFGVLAAHYQLVMFIAAVLGCAAFMSAALVDDYVPFAFALAAVAVIMFGLMFAPFPDRGGSDVDRQSRG